MTPRIILQSFRPAFLLLTPICVLLGYSTAAATHQPLEITSGMLALLGALCAHISVNALNEYHDFRSGLDLLTQKTSFSGGSGALPAHPQWAKAVSWLGWLALVITIAIGGYLVMRSDGRLFLIGVAGVLLIATYTPWINRHPLLCLMAPGTGFGLLMVTGTHLVLTGPGSELPWWLALVPFFLVNNLLLLNQYPDIDADARAGRRTFPIVFGLKASHAVYALFTLLAYGVIVGQVLWGALSKISLWAVLPMVLNSYALAGAVIHAKAIGKHPRYLAANVIATLLVPLLLSGSFWITS